MAGERKSFYDNRNYNPVQKAASSVGKYVGNVAKEAKDFGRAWKAADEAKNKIGPGTDAAAVAARKKQDAEFGQLAGAIFRGYRYNEKGQRK